MSKLKQKWTILVLLFFGQVLTYVALYEVLWRLLQVMPRPLRRDISWGITAKYSVCIFIFLSLSGAVANNLTYWKHPWPIYSSCVGIFFLFFARTWMFMPYRVSLLAACAALGLGIPFVILQNWKHLVKC